MKRLLTAILPALLFVFFLPSTAHSAPPQAEANQVPLDREDLMGLCTEENKDMLHYQIGICDTLNQFMEKPCMAELVEKVRKRFIGEKGPGGKTLDEFHMPYTCERKDGKGTTADIGKSPVLWRNFLITHFMGICISETKMSLVEPRPNPNPEYGGPCNLHKEQMDAEENKCGCETINSKNSSDPNVKYAGDKGGTGPYDNHAAFMCAAYIALKWADKDGTFMGGDDDRTKKPKGYEAPKDKNATGDTRKGAARFWESLQDKRQSKESEGSKTKNSVIARKVKAFCEKHAFDAPDSKERKFNEDVSPDGKVRPATGSNGQATY